MRLVSDFKEYQILDLGEGEKLERWGDIVLVRPDPQVIWPVKNNTLWQDYHARYKRSSSGGGSWEIKKDVPNSFLVNYHDMKFNLKLMGFKHTGLFPEQATNWNLVRDVIKKGKKNIKVLNLFAYTGAMSVAALMEGASVVHVDASRGMVDWAKENVKLNHLEERPIRFIVDDCVKFVKREIKRGNKYDIILMDPPSFGRGSKHEVWSIEKDLFNLVHLCSLLLSDDASLFLINSYSTGLSKTIMEDVLKICLKGRNGVIESDEIGLPVRKSDLVLPCGMTTYWQAKE